MLELFGHQQLSEARPLQNLIAATLTLDHCIVYSPVRTLYAVNEQKQKQKHNVATSQFVGPVAILKHL